MHPPPESSVKSRADALRVVALRVVTPSLVLFFAWAPHGLAQPELPFQLGNDLTEPYELCPLDDGTLSVAYTVREARVPVEVLDTTDDVIVIEQLMLRSYHLAEGGGWRPCPGSESPPIGEPLVPGLTFRLTKSQEGKSDGTRFSLKLVNELPPPARGSHDCNPVYDVQNKVAVAIEPGETCGPAAFPEVPQTYPECFHGDNTTNFHYHGFHISPQAPQDWVLLELEPVGVPCSEGNSNCRQGTYQYRLDPIPYEQAEGTHWYHPHKHGSTALQVLNGMAGTFVIEGPFDRWLESYYRSSGGIEDKVLVVQQIEDTLNFFREAGTTYTKGCGTAGDTAAPEASDCSTCPDSCVCFAENSYAPPQPAINGQINPVITMRSGEVQRWRFVGATMQASAQIEIGFPHKPGSKESLFGIKQIAQDGVQFAPANYAKQPLLLVEDSEGRVETNIELAPGNRVDLLVQAPTVEVPTTYFVNRELFGQVDTALRKLIEAGAESALDQLQAELTTRLKTQTKPPLLTVRVLPEGRKMTLPPDSAWPAMPAFLADIETVDRPLTSEFSMTGTGGQASNAFYVNDVQYCLTCANYTLPLGTADEWVVTNTYEANAGAAAPRHPFHIHVNPFQLRTLEYWTLSSDCDTKDPQCTNPPAGTACLDAPKRCVKTYDPPIWMDTIALPAAITVQDGEKLTVKDSTTVFRQRYESYTGPFVLHCHFLGHEDRGMMLNVQAVCPESGTWGTPVTGGPDDCQTPREALPPCSGECSATGHGH